MRKRKKNAFLIFDSHWCDLTHLCIASPKRTMANSVEGRMLYINRACTVLLNKNQISTKLVNFNLHPMQRKKEHPNIIQDGISHYLLELLCNIVCEVFNMLDYYCLELFIVNSACTIFDIISIHALISAHWVHCFSFTLGELSSVMSFYHYLYGFIVWMEKCSSWILIIE